MFVFVVNQFIEMTVVQSRETRWGHLFLKLNEDDEVEQIREIEVLQHFLGQGESTHTLD